MPLSAIRSLQKAIFLALTNDINLTTLLNGPNIFDHVPQKQPTPYIVISQITSRDWSTGDTDGQEHTITLHIWSDTPGRKELLEILHSIRTILHDATLNLEDHTLINLRQLNSETKREKNSKIYMATTRFRAVTEPVIS